MSDPLRIYWPEPHPAGRVWREQQEKLLSLMERLSPADPAYGDTYEALSWIYTQRE